MQKLKITLWERYKYEVEVPDNPTLNEMAWAISLAVHETEGKTKFTGHPRTYNYVKECLLRHTAHNFRFNASSPTPEMEKDIYAAANELNAKSKAVKVKCEDCRGEGVYSLEHFKTPFFCEKCNGHGFIIERQAYRVGNTFSNKLVIDIDGKDEQNLIDVKGFYETLLNLKFSVFKTNGGYWLIGDKNFDKIDDFKFAHAKVLNPGLEGEDYKDYIRGLLALDKKSNGEFHGASAEDIRKSKFYRGHGNFDVAFTFLSIKRERSTLRESKKNKNDKIEMVQSHDFGDNYELYLVMLVIGLLISAQSHII